MGKAFTLYNFAFLSRMLYCSIHLEKQIFLLSSPYSFLFLPFLSPFIHFLPFVFSLSVFSSLFLLSLPFFFFSHLYNLKIFPNDLKKFHPPPGGGNTEQYTSLQNILKRELTSD